MIQNVLTKAVDSRFGRIFEHFTNSSEVGKKEKSVNRCTEPKQL